MALLASSVPAHAQAPARAIHISVDERQLWLIEKEDTLFTAPVGVGMGTTIVVDGRRHVFETPRGTRSVLGKEKDPQWVPPDWHYYEKAQERGLRVVRLEWNDRHMLSDGTSIDVRGGEVGRVNRSGRWRAWTPGTEVILGDKIFMPPLGSPQRKIDNILGTHKLVLGDGYLIHGTDQPRSVAQASSHGCLRMLNEDVALLYAMVDVGTPVVIR